MGHVIERKGTLLYRLSLGFLGRGYTVTQEGWDKHTLVRGRKVNRLRNFFANSDRETVQYLRTDGSRKRWRRTSSNDFPISE